MGMAGLWETLALAGRGARAQLHDRHHDAERIVRGSYNRMPVVLKTQAWPAWLARTAGDGAATQGAAGALLFQ
jgi:putative SOS response-associated peptidase YedK